MEAYWKNNRGKLSKDGMMKLKVDYDINPEMRLVGVDDEEADIVVDDDEEADFAVVVDEEEDYENDSGEEDNDANNDGHGVRNGGGSGKEEKEDDEEEDVEDSYGGDGHELLNVDDHGVARHGLPNVSDNDNDMDDLSHALNDVPLDGIEQVPSHTQMTTAATSVGRSVIIMQVISQTGAEVDVGVVHWQICQICQRQVL